MAQNGRCYNLFTWHNALHSSVVTSVQLRISPLCTILFSGVAKPVKLESSCEQIIQKPENDFHMVRIAGPFSPLIRSGVCEALFIKLGQIICNRYSILVE